MSVAIVFGTRPQIVKSAPIVYEALRCGLDLEVIHTGQHYDYLLSQVFIEEFGLPEPVVNLGVGSGSHAYQTGEIMLRLEKYLMGGRYALVLIPGDTNSALAGALTSVKLGIPVAHVEAGARCYDMSMAEEVNRRLIDHCSKLLFAPTLNCKRNLEKESVVGEIYLTGDTMYDVFLRFRDKAEKSNILEKLNLVDGEYGLLTLHRAENVDDPVRLRSIFEGIKRANIEIIFPIHPRTANRLREYGISLEHSNIRIIDPVGYVDMLKLLKHARLVLTDSGGLQKEAFWSKTPCVTLRDRTEWVETVEAGVNFLVGTDA
ncbi:MAG: UDP-N-acetylglucosamine 2-epimerase (non-hydrolyzing), partial [Candidatus Verstraetearchaeota archaeon]|nr:UDP-N-acetylglucosamine 2-epimerase (non-hydrolyzing) [Candidatus Verstraetearchaeota archaeon]